MVALLDTLFTLIGYRFTEQIYSGSKTIVCRGIREQDQKPVIIKLMRNEYPTFNEIAQFRNQYTISKNLNLTGIVKPYELETYRNGYALILEDFGGISLKDALLFKSEEGKNPNFLDLFFHIAIEITSTLEGMHRNRVIHKDIKPANILINPSTLEVKLIDFSIASLLPREIQFITNPNVLEGTLAYISPEQTGRMNRGIDYRSDFYSLGVTFFELLTGKLPFITADSMELVYCHIAKQSPKANSINPNIPPILSEIISKLMAKNAEDRYQSALGLKHDLELCRQQWQETGNIAFFELAQEDICDRFLIPEKLYGRQREIKILLAAIDRVISGTTEMILVAGSSGIGKTAVINEVHKPIVRQRSYFIKGKFDQFQRDIPLSALVQAFRDLIGQLLSETDAQIEYWKIKILSVLGEQGQVITDVIPELESIIGRQQPVTELSGNAIQNRFNLLFQKFIRVFTTKDHPLVIFLDDLQWADSTSLKFIELLMGETATVNQNPSLSSLLLGETNKDRETDGGLLLIGAYRDNEVDKAHPLELTIKQIELSQATINTITLEPLNQGDLNLLIADTMRCEEKVAIPLTQMVFAKTKGNPFFTHQFIKCLHSDGLIEFNFELGYWQCDIPQVKALALTDDVVEFMALQLMKLPSHTQKVLKLAACIGNEFDLKTLTIIHEESAVDTASDLWQALIEGLVFPQAEFYKFFDKDANSQKAINHEKELSLPKYKFVHDRVQQAAYSLIPEDNKQSIHLKIGELLLRNIPVAEQEEKIFDLVNQFNMALPLITLQDERDGLARMNLIAGRKALASMAYLAAVKYLTTGIELLTDDSWERKYDLALGLYETAAEATYLGGDFEQTEQLAEVVLTRAKTLLEKVKVYEVKIQAYGAQNQALIAVNTALIVLKQLGVEFPENPSQSDVQLAMAEIASALTDRSIEDLINLPEMTERYPLEAMRILSSTIGLAYQAVPELFPLILFKQINLSLQHGNAPLSAFAYVSYAVILCGVVGDIESGYQFGKLAETLLAKFNAKEVKAKIIEVFNATIRHWKEPAREVLKPLLEAYSAGLETGDLEFAAYALHNYSYCSYFIGRELTGLDQEMATYSNVIAQMKQETVFNWSIIYRQSVLNLLGSKENYCYLIGEVYNEQEMLATHLEANDGMGLLYLYLAKLYLCYLFQEFQQALENATLAEKYLDGGIGQLVYPIFHFFDSLTRLAVYPNVGESEQKQILKKVAENQTKMRHWANHAPMNYLHKFYLVEAERHRVGGEYLEAMDDYDRAITNAKENEYINEEALAHELAAKFYLEWGKQKIAATYLTDAYYCYVRWGALAKVEDLQKRYAQLLAPIIQQEQLSFHPNEKSTASIGISLSVPNTQETVISNTSISQMLDLGSVIKASQALSGEIELEQLLSTLITVVMENAGASKCVLILSEGDNLDLTVTAVGSSSNEAPISTKFPSVHLESSSDIPVTLINYVKRTKEIFVIDDAKTVNFLIGDRYIVRQQPKSLLCIPIINQGKLLGILYLENNLTTQAFTRDRVEILKLLTTQAAISLENAILYKNLAQANENLEEYSHTLEEKVEERTQELSQINQSLQQALSELKNTQTHLIQTEKMSSLGQMVAGIAHEINNPINFIHGNISHASGYVQDLLDLITIYQQEYANPSPVLEEKAEELDLDFLIKDLPKLLDSMKVGSSRIRNIVLSLRNFSRLDESEMKPVDIHEGIDNTLMILQHRLKEKSDSPEIEVIKEYGQLPLVSCYAGQLNQAFMNILSNAIDALQQSNDNAIATDRKVGQIRIRTSLVDSNTLRIQIADNGHGMSDKVRQKIFDPFFTTKPIGSGTGLGLSISYQVVVDKHKGKLTCDSTPGKGTEFVIDIPLRQ
ncbi:trifunctional serine/threonine-protein kinase/ATP-binding protein/sensor histidine kinase [Tolypothrix sp. VBCCA 56010]|uniref:trifunctional serine/threonine-protein kinase/ATP-binding protein/sensor histidine kinase n=1 Tax=Tolypothrix sp. VBCCA 56010 TaxID=3137731 RepID=UPI003D7C36DB